MIYGALDVDRLIDDDFHCSDDNSFHMTCSGDPDLDKQSIGYLSLEFKTSPSVRDARKGDKSVVRIS